MRDRIEEVIKHFEAAWGPLPLRRLTDAVEMMKAAISASTQDKNVRRAIFLLFLGGVEEKNIPEDDFVEKSTMTGILQHNADLGKNLYLLLGYAAQPNEHPFRDVDYVYDEYEVIQEKILHEDFEDVVLEAHERLGRIIESGPSSMTNCEVFVHMIDDGSLIPLGKWVWDRKENRTHWIDPDRQ